MSRKSLYFSQAQYKGKSRGNSRGQTPDKRSLEDDLDMADKDIMLMKEAFDIMDTEGTGVISKEALEATLGMLKGACEIGEKMLKGLAELNEINFYEFVNHVQNSKGDPKTNEGIDSIFKLVGNEEGKIDFESLKNLCKELGDKVSDEEIKNSIEKIAPGRGYITQEEFKTLMKPRRRR
jgi:Ca2+-binding EF-hand superfamily protein